MGVNMQKSNKNICYLIIVLIYAILSQTIFPKLGQKFTNIINPIFWIIFLIVIYITVTPRIINKKNEKKIIQYSIVAALAYIIIYFLSGLLVSFGASPYSNTIKGILTNFWVTGTIIIGREFIRQRIIAETKKKQIELIKILVIIVFTILEFDITSFIKSITNFSVVFEKIVSSLIPIIIKNILFTMIVQKYTCKSTITYELLTKMFYWVAPILPNSPWILIAILDSTILLVLLVFVQADIDNSNSIMLNRRPANSNPKDIIKLGIILVPVACFAVGLFPIHPKAIATASMYPEIEIGDVVIVKKCTINDLNKGDVIEYQIEKQNIVHRVERIENENGIFKIITKGDNNTQEDAKPVYAEQIKGKVIFKVKYLGLPSIWLNNLTRPKEEILVETGK